MPTTIAVVDGMGGGIGTQIVTQIRKELSPDVRVLALGTNAIATDRMMQAKANRGASGPNAIRVSIDEADYIIGPIGIVLPNALMGEVTPEIAQAVANARGHKLLLPIRQSHFEIVGVEWRPLTKQISLALDTVRRLSEEGQHLDFDS